MAFGNRRPAPVAGIQNRRPRRYRLKCDTDIVIVIEPKNRLFWIHIVLYGMRSDGLTTLGQGLRQSYPLPLAPSPGGGAVGMNEWLNTEAFVLFIGPFIKKHP